MYDETKFVQITRDPIIYLKNKLNKLIEYVNAQEDGIKLSKLIWNYKPAYIYGNLKIHKNKTNPKLRQIISQIPSPIHKTAQEIIKSSLIILWLTLQTNV